ncbi:MAG: hypothetical protein Q4D79_06715 [Propionibacteriaceae bacterium]|nr:hypothetical protein [Propionibacteriaceae bacterium]
MGRAVDWADLTFDVIGLVMLDPRMHVALDEVLAEKLSDKGTKSANKRVDPLRSQTQLPREQIIESFLAHFERKYSTRRRDYTQAELAAAQHLLVTCDYHFLGGSIVG